jgi:hypothetical protein
MLHILSRNQSSGELLHRAKLFLLLFDNHVIDRPNWTQVRVKDTDARAWFDRGRYRSAKLIIDKPGPGQIKPLRIRTVRANDQSSSRLVTGNAPSLGRYDRCCYRYSLYASYRSRCPIMPRAVRSSLRKRRRYNEHASDSNNCFSYHNASLVLIPKVRSSMSCRTLPRRCDLMKILI